MIRKSALLSTVGRSLEEVIRVGSGIRRTISISNTMKITARRKNRSENGIRALWLGSNPHSNEVVFSRSGLARMKMLHASSRRIRGIIAAMMEDIRSILI
jgi:hypothetical protein